MQATERLYIHDTYLVETSATVLSVDSSSGLPGESVVVLDRTIFHPQGGGQPSDTGLIFRAGGDSGDCVFEVVAAKLNHHDGVIHHHGRWLGGGSSGSSSDAATFAAGDIVELRVDEMRRSLHARLHSAGHALDAALQRLGYDRALKPAKGYHFPSGSYVEYEGSLPADQRAGFIEAVNAELRKLVSEDIATVVENRVGCTGCRTISSASDKVERTLPFPLQEVDAMHGSVAGEAEGEGAGAEAGPAAGAHRQQTRIVSVGGTSCPCGGTHVRSTGELGDITVTKIK
ncbi:unnamed protein product, partial [Phaeothamnion confervicola]